MIPWKWTVAAAVLLAGCSGGPEDAGFPEVQRDVAKALPQEIRWNRGSKEDAEAAEAVRRLLEAELTVDAGVQVALLNDPHLQAEFEELGVAQADLVQAGLLSNPVFSAGVGFPSGSPGGTAWSLDVVQDFLDLLTLSARKDIARADLEAARLRVADAVLAHAARAKSAWYAAVGAAQAAEVRRRIADAADASAELAKRLREAGNLSELELARERGHAEEARRARARADAEAELAREDLNRALGLWGAQTSWKAPAKLPELPAAEAPLERLESVAVGRRLDLAAAVAGKRSAELRLGLARDLRWIGGFSAGAWAERDSDRQWIAGPRVSLAIPLFDRRQGEIAALEALARQRGDRIWADAVRIRSEVRAARIRVVAARALAEHQRDVVVPLRERIVELTQKEYNFMLAGVPDLIAAKQREYEAYVELVNGVRDYWTARAELERAIGARLKDE